MGGFKAFILKGNLIEIATGLIMALAFASVVTHLHRVADRAAARDRLGDLLHRGRQSFGAFLNAVISFLIMAAVVYFFIVVALHQGQGAVLPGRGARHPGRRRPPRGDPRPARRARRQHRRLT